MGFDLHKTSYKHVYVESKVMSIKGKLHLLKNMVSDGSSSSIEAKSFYKI